jgi:pseudouridylate synthase
LTAVLVVNPVPELDAIPRAQIEPVIDRATKEAEEKKIHGQALTPFLLQRISDMTAKRSMRANLALLLNNAQLAAEVAVAQAAWKPKERELKR